MEFPAIPWESIGTVGLCVLVTWLVVTGRLVPRITVDAMMTDLRAQVAATERRADAHEAAETELLRQNSTLLIQAEIWDRVLRPASSPPEMGAHVATTVQD